MSVVLFFVRRSSQTDGDKRQNDGAKEEEQSPDNASYSGRRKHIVQFVGSLCVSRRREEEIGLIFMSPREIAETAI